MKIQDEINQLLQANLVKAQQCMKFYADLKQTDKQYKVGDWVYLKIQPYRQTTLSNTHFHKLAARYYGLYKVLEMIDNVAYKLELPIDSKIHNIFHVSLLKPSHGSKPVSTTLPFADSGGHFVPQPLVILARTNEEINL